MTARRLGRALFDIARLTPVVIVKAALRRARKLVVPVSKRDPIHPIIRILADDAPYDCEVAIEATDDDYAAICFDATRSAAFRNAVARFRAHRRWLRKQRAQLEAPVTIKPGRSLDNDPILQMSKWAQEDIAAARKAQAFANIASRFMVDAEPDNTNHGVLAVEKVAS